MRVTDTHAHIHSPDKVRYPMTAQPLRPPAGTGVEALWRVAEEESITINALIHVDLAADLEAMLWTTPGRLYFGGAWRRRIVVQMTGQ